MASRWVVVVLLFVAGRAGFAQRSAPPGPRTPAAGSAVRRGGLDAIRSSLGSRSRFDVSHFLVSGRWAFVVCHEVVDADGELQETDLTVNALLARDSPSAARWRVVEIWTLPSEEERPYRAFATRVRARVKTDSVPATILPDELPR